MLAHKERVWMTNSVYVQGDTVKDLSSFPHETLDEWQQHQQQQKKNKQNILHIYPKLKYVNCVFDSVCFVSHTAFD